MMHFGQQSVQSDVNSGTFFMACQQGSSGCHVFCGESKKRNRVSVPAQGDVK